MLAAGVSDEAFEDAVTVAALFNAIDRIADTFEFEVPTPKVFAKVGRILQKRGYS